MSKICKNCGIENDVNAKYCSECGQSLSVGRLQPKTFFAEIMSGLLRLNRGMLFTSWNLLIHPWKVIRDYIHGKRISYTPPVNLLILLMFILALLEKFGRTMSGIVVKESVPDDVSDASLWYRIGLSVSSMFEGPSAFSRCCFIFRRSLQCGSSTENLARKNTTWRNIWQRRFIWRAP